MARKKAQKRHSTSKKIVPRKTVQKKRTQRMHGSRADYTTVPRVSIHGTGNVRVKAVGDVQEVSLYTDGYDGGPKILTSKIPLSKRIQKIHRIRGGYDGGPKIR